MEKEMSVLKGNFETRKKVKPVELKNEQGKEEDLSQQMKKRALASLGGSMVYMERKKRVWDGEQG